MMSPVHIYHATETYNKLTLQTRREATHARGSELLENKAQNITPRPYEASVKKSGRPLGTTGLFVDGRL